MGSGSLPGLMDLVRAVWDTRRIFHLHPALKGRREQSEPTTLAGSIS